MALPSVLEPGLLPSEIEYLATTTTDVQIVPLTSIDRARFLSGVYGPFRPPQRTTVPLWLALNLRSKGKCYLVPPDWMLVENLKQLLQRETTDLAFAEVPFHYVSVARAILEAASDDVPQADEVRSLLKDLREARQSKIASGLEMINPYHLEMTNIAYAELCELRPFFSTAFRHLKAMQPPAMADAAAAAAGDSQQPWMDSFDLGSGPAGLRGRGGGGGGGSSSDARSQSGFDMAYSGAGDAAGSSSASRTRRRDRAGGGGGGFGGQSLDDDSMGMDESMRSSVGGGAGGRGDDDDEEELGMAAWAAR